MRDIAEARKWMCLCEVCSSSTAPVAVGCPPPELQELEQKKRELQMKEYGIRRCQAAAVLFGRCFARARCMMHLITAPG